MRLPKGFVFGALYLVSGIYSIGFSLVMSGVTQPMSGKTAYIPVPDSLFPFEVIAFALFGALFLAASAYHFRMSYQALSVNQAGYSAKQTLP
jgi:hypothetical protein